MAKNGDDPTRHSNLPALIDAPDFKSIYANLAFLSKGEHDVVMTLCRVIPSDFTGATSAPARRAEKLINVYMSVSHARNLYKALGQVLGDEATEKKG